MTMTDPHRRPEGIAPEPDLESAAWWAGLAAHRIMLQRCGECGRMRFPSMPRCPWCSSSTFDMAESTGRGVVYSFVTAHVAISPGYEGPLPYTVATVALAEGPRLLGRVEPPAPLAIGVQVVAGFVEHASWTELTFVPDPGLS